MYFVSGSPKLASKPAETTSAVPDPLPVMPPPQETVASQKSKKSGYQKQREELFGSATTTTKVSLADKGIEIMWLNLWLVAVLKVLCII